jgi:hypothetical protein
MFLFFFVSFLYINTKFQISIYKGFPTGFLKNVCVDIFSHLKKINRVYTMIGYVYSRSAAIYMGSSNHVHALSVANPQIDLCTFLKYKQH